MHVTVRDPASDRTDLGLNRAHRSLRGRVSHVCASSSYENASVEAFARLFFAQPGALGPLSLAQNVLLNFDIGDGDTGFESD